MWLGDGLPCELMKRRRALLGAAAALNAVIVVIVGLVASIASADARWPGPLEWLRTFRWPFLGLFTVAGVALAILAVLVSEPTPVRESELDAASTRLAEKVRSDLEAQIGRLQLSRPVPIAVRWSSTGRPVQAPASVVTEAEQRLAGDVTQLSGLIRGRLPRRQLVVLGAPGAGKSVAALLLARDLVRQRDPKEPVPVLLSLSSWRPEADLHSWVAKHVLALCPVLAAGYGRDIAERLVKQGRVMPVLDSLDELPGPLRAHAVEAIDKAVADGDPLLVTCRGTEYERMVARSRQHLTRAAVVELEPVAPQAAIEFLRASCTKGDTRWDPVFDRLRSELGSPLGRALSSPLMLYLAREAYRPGTKNPRELLDSVRFGSREAIEGHLLEIFIPTVYAPSPDIRYRPRPVEGWLRFMATRMRRDDTVDFTWTQVRSLLPASLSAVLYGVVFGWFTYLLFGLSAGISVMIFAALAAGLAGLMGWAIIDLDDKFDDPKSALRRRRFADLLASGSVACVQLLVVACWLDIIVGAASRVAWEYGIAAGVGLGVAFLLCTRWGFYEVSHAWFWLTRRLPWRLAAFLDEAHRIGVLRLNGPAYQFRHVRLLGQLSGITSASGPQEDSGPQETARRPHLWRLVLANLSFAGLVLLPVLLIGAMVIASRGDALEYQSGDRPATQEPLCDFSVGSCAGNFILTWELHPNSTIHTVLGPPPDPSGAGAKEGIGALAGELVANGCAQAWVQVTITVSGLHLRPFTMGLVNRPAKVLAPFPSEPYGNPIVKIALHRLDARPCTLRFSWISPGVSYDQDRYIRNRFSHLGLGLGPAQPNAAEPAA